MTLAFRTENTMRKSLITAAIASIGLAACSGTRVPTDAELATLLRQSGADQGGADASRSLDPSAVQCLAAYSGDAELAHEVSPAALSDIAKSQCRRRLDLWIADAQRNPEKFKFDEIDTPAVAKRAMKMYLDNGGAPLAPSGDEPEKPSVPATPASAPIADGPAPDMDKTLLLADDICRDAKAAVARGPFNARLQRYSDSCESDVATTRAKVDQYRQQNRQGDIDAEARRLARMNESGQKLLERFNGG